MRFKEIFIAILFVVALLGLTQIPMGFAQNLSALHAQYLPAVFKDLPTPTATLPPPSPTSPGPTLPFVELRNGSFEEGDTVWVSVFIDYPIITQEFPPTVDAHGGVWAAWLGGVYDETTAIVQQVTIPQDRPYLSYWRWIASADLCLEDDIAGISLLDDSCSVTPDEIVEAFELCRDVNTSGWVKRTIDVSRFAGQTRTLVIAASTDGLLNSNLFVDDISFQASPSAGSAAVSLQSSEDASPRAGGTVAPARSQVELPAGLIEQIRAALE